MAGRKKRSRLPKIKRIYIFSVLFLIVIIFFSYLENLLGVGITRLVLLLLGVYLVFKLYERNNNIKFLEEEKKAGIRRKIPRDIFKKIPTIIWGGFAVFGIFLFGVLVGGLPSQTDVNSNTKISSQSDKYKNVIDGYQDLSRLFYLQQQDMDIIIDSSIWQDHPEELSDAISSYKKERDEILFQFGRVYELRNKASLPRDENLKSN